MVAIEPGSWFLYTLPIPEDHPSGLFFYHPHHHGSTDVQVAGGMVGMLVVRGPIDTVPEIEAAREIFICIQSLCLNPKSQSEPDQLQFEFVAYQPAYPGLGYNCAFTYMCVMVNDQLATFVDYTPNPPTFKPYPAPEYSMQPGEVVRLRILNGTNFMFMPLSLPGMDVFIIVRHGINLLEPVLLDQPEPPVTHVDVSNLYAGTTIDMSATGRAEVLIRATTPGRYTLRSVAITGVADINYPSIDLAYFTVQGAEMPMSIPTALPPPTREYPLIADSEIARTRILTFSEKISSEILTGIAFLLNDKSYDEQRIDWQPVVGTAEAWRLVNTTSEGHPLHTSTRTRSKCTPSMIRRSRSPFAIQFGSHP
jgi:suppressor of ftsI